MKKHINTFSKGITRDINVNKFPNDNVYWAQNMRIVDKDGLATGALTNVDGTLPKLTISGGSIIAECQIRDTLILFVHTDAGGQIYKWDYTESDFPESATLIYENSGLNFTLDNKITSVGIYENETTQKIYFSDGLTFFYHLNIVEPEGGYPITSSLSDLEMVPDVEFSTMNLDLRVGGNLKAGRIQYSYQLYNRKGNESAMSPVSQMVDLTNSSDETGSTLNYKGDEVGTVVNKSINVRIENIDDEFERIRLYALEYTVYDQVPSVRLIGEYEIQGGSSNILDTGESVGEYTLEQYRFIPNNFYPKSIAAKDNILFAANLTQDYFTISDEEWDTRAFRFNIHNQARVYDDNGVGTNITYSGGVLSNVPGFKHAAYNNYNSVHGRYFDATSNTSLPESELNEKNIFNPATGTLGGYGPNISYVFTTKKVVLDEASSRNPTGYLGKYPRITCEVEERENHANPLQDVGYQRDEVYRFAIVPIDIKGRPGFAKWIGDIKFPTNSEIPFIEYENDKTYANILGIKFTVNTTPITDKISGYMIVRCLRTTSDRTILGQGIIAYLCDGGPDSEPNMMSQASVPLIGDLYHEKPVYGRLTDDLPTSWQNDRYTRKPSGAPSRGGVGPDRFNPKYIDFTSPEVNFNKNKFSEASSFIEAFGTLKENIYVANSSPRTEARDRDQFAADKFKDFVAGKNNKSTRAFLSTNKIYTPKDYSGNAAKETLPDGRTFNNKASNMVETDDKSGKYDDRFRRYGLKGTFNLCTVKTTSGDADLETAKLQLEEFYRGDLLEVVIGNYKVDKSTSQYGGSTYETRSYNNYYPASEFIPKDTSVSDVYGGDTYISFYTYARALWGPGILGEGDTIEAYVFFPVETSINLELRLDQVQSYINWGARTDTDGGVPNYNLQETVQEGVLKYGEAYPIGVGDLYRYNSAYSTISKGIEYFTQPFDFTSQEKYDVRITASEKKINGEYTDSWTIFRFNNYIDVDTKHHAITRILTFKNNLFYIQATGVGIASVNQRSLVQDNNPGALALGTGGILPRYDYITDKSGSEFHDGIVASDDFIYYVDGRRKRINKLVSSKEEAISIVKGIDSLLTDKPFQEVRAGFDRGYNEVIFSIDNSLTIAFNELVDAFSSSYTYNPGLMFSMNKDFFSVGVFFDDSPWQYQSIEDFNVGYTGTSDVDPIWDFLLIGGYSAGDALHKHNVGPKGLFYNDETGPDDSIVTLIINPNGNIVNSYDNLDLRTEATSDGTDKTTDTFYLLEAENDYQSITRNLNFQLQQPHPGSGNTQHIGSIKRIGRVWRTPILPVQTSGANFKRMIDTYIKLTLKYANVDYDTFRVHDITTYYRQTNY